MVKLVSNRLNKSLSKVYSLSRKNKNETILIWIFLDSDRINNYKKFINLIPDSKNIGVIFRSKKIKKEYHNVKELLKLCKKKRIGPARNENNRPLFMKKDLGILARSGFDFDTSKRVLDIEKEEYLKIINLL